MTTNQTWQPIESEQRLLSDLARVRAQFQLEAIMRALGNPKKDEKK